MGCYNYNSKGDNMKKLAVGLLALSFMFTTATIVNAATTNDKCTCNCQKKCECHCCKKGDCKCGPECKCHNPKCTCKDCKCTCPACKKSHESFVKKFMKCECETK